MRPTSRGEGNLGVYHLLTKSGRPRGVPTTRPKERQSFASASEVQMKMVKSLLLGSAAGLTAVTGAQAADMPVKARPVEYVRICSLYGEGFFYIPGTDTCLKLG